MPSIAVIGSNNVDLVTTISRLPAAGETMEAISFAIGPGGKGANQAVAAAKLGSEVMLVSAVGADVFGASTLETLAQAGVDTAHVRQVDGVANGTATILVTADGENRILINTGANGCIGPEDVDRAMPAISGCGLLLLQHEIPLETVYHAIDRARDAGIPVLLNPAPAKPELEIERIRSVAFFAPNQTELAILTGLPTGTRDEAEAAARVLTERGIGAVIVTLGGDGALLVPREGSTLHVPSVAVAAVDTTGAGDAFIGAFAHHHVGLGLEVGDAMRKAAAYAALAVTRQGAQTSFANAAEFAAFRGRRD